MIKLPLVVIKLGGSLLHSKELSKWLDSIELVSKHANIVIVPGGGEFADKVRDLQSVHRFNDELAHRMALLAMSQYGYFLTSLNPRINIDDKLNVHESGSDITFPYIWLPMTLLDDFSEIPASWDYTSDSIALWLANRMAAPRLILVKSKAVPDVTLTLKKLIEKGYLDKGFQKLIDRYMGQIIWLEKTQFGKLEQLIKTEMPVQANVLIN